MIKLMIVEDEPLERLALRKMIHRLSYDMEVVEDARDGEEAIDKVKLLRPHILLMDIRMPEKNGLEAQEEIIRAFPNTKTIILTAYSDFNYAREAIQYGVVDYLLKPVPPQVLKTALDKAISSLHQDEIRDSRSTAIKPPELEENLIDAALNYIHHHIKTDITLADVAGHVHLNPQYFSRLFKSRTGATFTEYVSVQKISRAKDMLLATNMPIYRIAIDLGFSDAAYFSRVFFKYEQLTPLQFKKKAEGQGN
ncbi:response regulator [Paenibacillus sp. BR2-3]|uniref:response regulator transcription factor n=1 Tax=Paenibacillus sp. BR2-3 TaxID=3048494 RepID=UPI0039773BCD